MSKFTLTIDEGNSKTDCSLFSPEEKLLSRFPIADLNLQLEKIHIEFQNINCILSSVKKNMGVYPFEVKNILDLYKDNQFLSMPINYNQTLGADRIACAFAVFQKGHQNTIIIDSGTFTTVDFVTPKGFMGGYILPGLNLIMQNYLKGENLRQPDLSQLENIYKAPQTTMDAINQGALLSFISPIKDLIGQNPEFKIILTGGNSQYLHQILLKLNICQDASIQIETNLIHIGLLEIAKKVNL